MNRIIVNRNRIDNYKDDEIEINNNKIWFYKDNKYEIEYIDCDDVKLEFMIDNAKIEILDYSSDNYLKIKNIYNINNGSLRIDKFYNNKQVDEEIDFNLMQDGDRVDYNFATISLGEENYIINVNHNNKNTISNIDNRSVALKNSKINYTINSRVLKDCVKSMLDQNTRIITVDECEAKISPNMFIDLDDVIAKHGSVIGTFKEDQVFYLMSKGISYNDTVKLLIKGYLLSKIKVNVDVRMKIMEIIDRYWR